MKLFSKLLVLLLSFSALAKSELAKPECIDGVCTIEKSCVRELSADEFQDVISQSKKPVVVDFYATWCKPCAQMKPLFAALAQVEKNYLFVSIDVDQAQDVMMDCSVDSLPSFVVFKNGKQWGMVQGAMDKKKLHAELKKIVATAKPADFTVVSDGLSKLIVAIVEKDLTKVKQLLKKNVDVNGVYKIMMFGSTTPLQAAVGCGTYDIIDTLIAAGARYSHSIEKNIKEIIVKNEKIYADYQKTISYAKEKIAKTPTRAVSVVHKEDDQEVGIAIASSLSNPAALRMLAKIGMDFNAVFEFFPDKKKITPLYLAIVMGNREAVDILIEGGASFEAIVIDQFGRSKTIGEIIDQDLGLSGQDDMLKRLEYAKKSARITG